MAQAKCYRCGKFYDRYIIVYVDFDDKGSSRKSYDICPDCTTELEKLLKNSNDKNCIDMGGEEGTNYEYYDFGCSVCGYACDLPQPNYCPDCGAKVIYGEE